MLRRLIKLLFFLLVICFLGLVGYAYFGEMSPDIQDVEKAVTIEVN